MPARRCSMCWWTDGSDDPSVADRYRRQRGDGRIICIEDGVRRGSRCVATDFGECIETVASPCGRDVSLAPRERRTSASRSDERTWRVPVDATRPWRRGLDLASPAATGGRGEPLWTQRVPGAAGWT